MCYFKEIENGCKSIIFNLGVPNLFLGRTSVSDMLKVVMSEPPFRNPPNLGGGDHIVKHTSEGKVGNHEEDRCPPLRDRAIRNCVHPALKLRTIHANVESIMWRGMVTSGKPTASDRRPFQALESLHNQSSRKEHASIHHERRVNVQV